jgi:hypothetical protein
MIVLPPLRARASRGSHDPHSQTGAQTQTPQQKPPALAPGRVGGRAGSRSAEPSDTRFPPPPLRTVHEVLPHTAQRHPSPGRMRGAVMDASDERAQSEVSELAPVWLTPRSTRGWVESCFLAQAAWGCGVDVVQFQRSVSACRGWSGAGGGCGRSRGTRRSCTVCAWCSTLISAGLLHDGYLSHGICLDCEALLAASDEELHTLEAAACS